MSLYSFYIQPYYDTANEQYINIVTINKNPNGPLSNYITTLRYNKLSDFSGFNKTCKPLCIYAIKNINLSSCNNLNLLSAENIDELVTFLIENNYTINKDITKIMNNEKIYVNNGKKLLFYTNYSS